MADHEGYMVRVRSSAVVVETIDRRQPLQQCSQQLQQRRACPNAKVDPYMVPLGGLTERHAPAELRGLFDQWWDVHHADWNPRNNHPGAPSRSVGREGGAEATRRGRQDLAQEQVQEQEQDQD
jgi:hypothetical protein